MLQAMSDRKTLARVCADIKNKPRVAAVMPAPQAVVTEQQERIIEMPQQNAGLFRQADSVLSPYISWGPNSHDRLEYNEQAQNQGILHIKLASSYSNARPSIGTIFCRSVLGRNHFMNTIGQNVVFETIDDTSFGVWLSIEGIEHDTNLRKFKLNDLILLDGALQTTTKIAEVHSIIRQRSANPDPCIIMINYRLDTNEHSVHSMETLASLSERLNCPLVDCSQYSPKGFLRALRQAHFDHFSALDADDGNAEAMRRPGASVS